MDLTTLQPFATELRKVLSRKTVELIIGIVLGALTYARERGADVPNVTFGDIELGSKTGTTEAPSLTREQVTQIIALSDEPFRTLAFLDWCTGVRAGELLSLVTADLDFDKKTIRITKTADDHTRQIRQAKTPKSVALLPMPSALETVLRDYLKHHWKPNPAGYLFPNPDGTRPRLRDNVVKYWLKPILKKLGIPSYRVGLHAFRHGLATELADASVPLPVLQSQMRHADVKTTLRVYTHVVQDSQRQAMEQVASQLVQNVPISTESTA
jgi:integrase